MAGFKGGWLGKILRINLSTGRVSVQGIDEHYAMKFIGGRGFAVEILWNEVKGVDPLSPDNKFIVATGPLTGLFLPSSGKVVVAAKSPLTYGYGDGNIGSMISARLKMAGYDAIVVEGRASKPSYIYIDSETIKIFGARDLWGRGAIETDVILRERHGDSVGTLVIGPAGENLVRFATTISEFGRAGGRPGMGAVMGSKNLKAIVVDGWKDIPVAYPDKLSELMYEAIKKLKESPQYDFWVRQGTMATIEWSQTNCVLPAFNFSEGVFEQYDKISGETMEKFYKVFRKGCFSCPMPCGNISKNKTGKYPGTWAELDYENVGMLGSNLGIGDMNAVIKLNLLADDLGLDTISAGGVIGFAIEAFKRGILPRELVGNVKLEWGDDSTVIQLMEMIAYRKGLGDLLAEGTRKVAEKLGGEAHKIAMHVKGLEISAYDCHTAPGMALAYGTSPIGAHHKDAWFIAWELKMGRDVVSREKVRKLIEMQRIRGGLFETFTVCRLPWIELGFPLNYYEKFFEAVTGIKATLNEFYEVADRIYNLMRAYWIREYTLMGVKWSRQMDYPPGKWFEEPTTKGPLAGSKINREVYDKLLSWYYEERGWDEDGVPRKSTLAKYGLSEVAAELEKHLKLTP
ncbi:MAG: aldehyde ferredoxin oxidoreductase [Thermoprotei archaeon]|nr:MAG: aldehyde ferredoxin oxidoreductase [Thermoprotei archaeon]